jgi:hypothetical protein
MVEKKESIFPFVFLFTVILTAVIVFVIYLLKWHHKSPQLQERRAMDPQEEVIKVAGGTGKVAPEYGGFEITVVKPDLFPWHAVLRFYSWKERKKDSYGVIGRKDNEVAKKEALIWTKMKR